MTHGEIKLYQNIQCNLLNALLGIQILFVWNCNDMFGFCADYVARENKIFLIENLRLTCLYPGGSQWQNRTEEDFVLSWLIWLITGIFTAHSGVPENIIPLKETSEKGGKADWNFSHKIQTFSTNDTRLCSTLRTLGMVKSWENRREYELLVHGIGSPDPHGVSRIIPTSEPSALTESIDFNLSFRFVKS